MRIYISGPITKDPNYKTKFAKAAAKIERAGHKVINPAVLADYAPGQPWSFYMTMALAALPWCDAIYMLEGYEDSPGAMIELRWAMDHNLKVYKAGNNDVPVR